MSKLTDKFFVKRTSEGTIRKGKVYFEITTNTGGREIHYMVILFKPDGTCGEQKVMQIYDFTSDFSFFDTQEEMDAFVK